VPDLPDHAASGDDDAFANAARPFWHPIARAGALGAGDLEGVTLLGEDLVVFRDHDGRLGLLEDLCAHRGTRLSLGEISDRGCLRCPYHGWSFDRDGACVEIPQLSDRSIPPRARVAATQVTEAAGLVWACLAPPGDEARGVPPVPEALDPANRVYVGEPIDWDCQSTRQVENFCDIAHFSFVHRDVFGNPDELGVEPHTVARSEDGWQLTTEVVYPAMYHQMPSGEDGRTPVVPTPFSYRVELPFVVHLTSTMGGAPYVLVSASQPITADRSRLFWVMVMPREPEIPDEMLEAMERQVFLADRRIVETQRPERVPLDPSVELQLPFDRMAVAYRRALAELGFPGDPRAVDDQNSTRGKQVR
jgi:vanillate O-demethylase monooxygenase subunit